MAGMWLDELMLERKGWSLPPGSVNMMLPRAMAAGCAWLGLALDRSRNSAARGLIGADTSRVKALVVPTDEQRMIARYTARTLGI